MKNKKAYKKERYSVIISSLTDARKKPFVFSITKRMLICVICAASVIVMGSAGAAVFTSSQATSCSAEADALKIQSDDQAALICSYSEQLLELKQFRYMNGIDSKGMKAERCEAGLLGQSLLAPEEAPKTCPDEAAEIEKSPNAAWVTEGNAVRSLYSESDTGIGGIRSTAIASIPMTEAIEQINASFQANIDAQIEEIKANEGFSEAEIIYNGNEDGDSNFVNNWADVLSIYAAITMREELRFMTITPENLKLLEGIYNEMNQVSFYTKTTPIIENDTENRSGSITKIKLSIYINVNSLTYSEDAELHDFDAKQQQKLEQLMSPSYYTYFADLLGLDVYDGMKSEDLQAIVSGLPEGAKGSDIVKTALIRLGHPYSNARRGRGNYVDCSYFVWWVYDQIGITLPTSSVQQAIYCYRNGYMIEKEDLKPGDLIFWSQRGCDRWRGIHHVGIYIGNDRVIDASKSRGRVVIRNLWGGREWRIAFYARPYQEDSSVAASTATVSERKLND
jgi:hypothetical protein